MCIKLKYLLSSILIISIFFTATYSTLYQCYKNSDIYKKQLLINSTNENEEESENYENNTDVILSFTNEKISFVYVFEHQALYFIENSFGLLPNYLEVLKPPPKNNF